MVEVQQEALLRNKKMNSLITTIEIDKERLVQLLESFIAKNDSNINMREDRAKTLVQLGQATFEILEKIFEESYSMFYAGQIANKLKGYLEQIVSDTLLLRESKNGEQTENLNNNILKSLKVCKNLLAKMRPRLNSEEDQNTFLMLGKAIKALGLLAVGDTSVFSLQREALHDESVFISIHKIWKINRRM